MLDVAGLNPWISMWNQPRSAIQAIAQSKPVYGVFFLSAIHALQSFFFYANWWSLGLNSLYPLYLTLGILLSPLLGLIWLYLMGDLLFLTGRLFGGRARRVHLRSAVAWSSIPSSIALLMWLLLLAASSESIFIHDYGIASSIWVNLISLIAGSWSFILLIQSVREIQSFSLLPSLCSVLFTYFLNTALFFFTISVLSYFV